MPTSSAPSIRQLYFKDTSFADLMTHRIYNVLMISSRYDAFIVEEDGRIEEQLFNEYASLNLRYPPRFTQVYTEDEAFEELTQRDFELVIAMSDSDGKDIFDVARRIKSSYPNIPIVILTPFSREVTLRIDKEDLSSIDYIFSWLGNTDLLLAIIKLLEDRMNVKEDVDSVGVQIVLFVEDSIHFSSSILPYLYKFIFHQSLSFMTEALNAHQQMLRMRGRPKILMARTYEEVWEIFSEFKNNILGVVSDIRFPHNGKNDKKAGIDLCRQIRKKNEFIPYILLSSETENAIEAERLQVSFIDKNSKTLAQKLKKHLLDSFGFGDFIFRDPATGEEIARAKNLKDLQNLIFTLPDDTLVFHLSQNHVSKWLYSRAMFPLAEFLRDISFKDFSNIDEARQTIFNAIVQYRKIKNQGVVAVFQRDRFDKYSNFARIGAGSMGGKARGLAFLNALIKRNSSLEYFKENEVQVSLPKTVVLCTDVFDEFMEQNNLYPIALSEISDEEILKYFLVAEFPERYREDFIALFKAFGRPIAVRSSSLLEDSYYQPFAGIYSTYMVPFDEDNVDNMLRMLTDAIKAVYASVFYRDSKAYMRATSNVIDSEKMAIVLQEVVGDYYGNQYYPSFSGVARSINFYPLGAEKPENGVANVALGLGKYVVDGGKSLRFSPKFPENVLQLSSLSIALKETQRTFNALDSSLLNFAPTTDDSCNILTLDLKDAEKDGTLDGLVSTYDPNDQIIRDGLYDGGRKLITFAGILKYNIFPLAAILQKALEIGQHEMGHPVEIEFAVKLKSSKEKIGTFHLLQIRPIVESSEVIVENLEVIANEKTIIKSQRILGNGIIDDVYDFVYIKPETFDPSQSREMVEEVDALNEKMQKEGRYYVLVGPGRWGSSDPWLGVPVKWSQISNARTIIESGLENFRVDPSQGTHFFHNLTSLQVGYFTINPYMDDGFYDLNFLKEQPTLFETKYLRHVRFTKPIVIKMDGKKSIGVVLKPKK
ncbi:MAG: phosphoenolpyruvate synthase [Prevotellaceae bacterium]|jgi:CheY-like chemotaxis protein|nr:phosphoenolpyruvate synthase [Prevotellaceae bacterium]